MGGKHLKHKSALLLASIAALLVVSFVLSLSVFGADDTLAFITQKKQAVEIYRPGGSWNLHLPSTVSLFFLIPVFIFTTNLLFSHYFEHVLDSVYFTLLCLLLYRYAK